VIAADIRQLHHISYTPTPDIIHESAGHAPIIADPDYANYLQYFGEIGSKAMFSKEDFELYDAIRKLSMLKELPNADPQEIQEMADLVSFRQKNMGEPSEMALLSRLHWWTVEYGLIGTPENPKIYGAGLLSSIGESVNCMKPEVQKLWYTSEAINIPFDITTEQPQLFVTPNFPHLLEVLEDFASRMSFKTGGVKALEKARSCRNVSTLVLDTGLQISGIISDFDGNHDKKDKHQDILFIQLTGPVSLAYDHHELKGLGIKTFPEGLLFPLGKATLTPQESEIGQILIYRYEHGMQVEGLLVQKITVDKKVLLFVIEHPTIKDLQGNKIGLEENFKKFYLPIGEKVVSVFNGAADQDAFRQTPFISTMKYSPVTFSEEMLQIHSLYAQVRKYRERMNIQDPSYLSLLEIWNLLHQNLEETWLCALELVEICEKSKNWSELKPLADTIRNSLENFKILNPSHENLIEDGFLSLLL
jgi:phenylalanine-4-hydroxylase